MDRAQSGEGLILLNLKCIRTCGPVPAYMMVLAKIHMLVLFSNMFLPFGVVSGGASAGPQVLVPSQF
eukprot:4351377-Amphidinium_carterae.1